MKQSKAGKKLNPALKEIVDPIFRRDPVRYKRLIEWIWLQQKQGWPDEAIGGAVTLAGERIHLAANWWTYLTSLLSKAKGKAAESEASSYKSEVGEIADEFIEFLKAR